MIEPITITTKAGVIFSSRGHGLEHEKQPFEDVYTKSGQVLQRLAKRGRRSKTWWQAQCLFRGMDVPNKLNMTTLQAQLQAVPNAPMLPELKEAEPALDREYNEKSKTAHEESVRKLKAAEEAAQAKAEADLNAKWPGMNAEGKAESDEMRLVKETFRGHKKQDASTSITVKVKKGSSLHYTAAALGLEYRFVKYPKNHKEREENDFCGLMVIAGSRLECDKNKDWIKAKNEAEAVKQQEKEQRQEERRPIDKRVRQAIRKGKDWDVTGNYEIKCPVVQRFDDDGKKLKLEIFTEDGEDCPQMFAKFNFGIIKGVMRFKRQDDGKCEPVNEATSRKRKRDDSDDGTLDENTSEEDSDDEVSEASEDEDEDEDYGRRSPTPEEFHLGHITTPSQTFPSWIYQWRGKEVGTGEIQLGSEVSDYNITFEPGGKKIEGTFGSDFHADCPFTGVKVAPGRDSSIVISDEWAAGNAHAHENARAGRWGRSRWG